MSLKILDFILDFSGFGLNPPQFCKMNRSYIFSSEHNYSKRMITSNTAKTKGEKSKIGSNVIIFSQRLMFLCEKKKKIESMNDDAVSIMTDPFTRF